MSKMQKGPFDKASPVAQLLLLVIIMVGCISLFMFVGMLMPVLIGVIPVHQLMNVANDTDVHSHVGLMRYMMILQGVGLFIIPAFFAARLFAEDAATYLQLRMPAYPHEAHRGRLMFKWFAGVLLLMLAAFPCINLLAALNEAVDFPEFMQDTERWLKDMEATARQSLELLLETGSAGMLCLNVLMIAVLPALGEELIFRGVLQRIFVRWTGNVHTAIVICGFLFSLMHMQFYGFFPRWLLGVMFGYLLVWGGTIWLPVFAHFINNTVAIVLTFLVQRGMIPEDVEILGASARDMLVTAPTLVVCALVLWWMYRRRMQMPHES